MTYVNTPVLLNRDSELARRPADTSLKPYHLTLWRRFSHAATVQLGGTAMDYLREQLPRGLEILRHMVEINSFTGNRQGVKQLGRYTVEVFAPLGFSAEFVPSANPEWGDHLVLTR